MLAINQTTFNENLLLTQAYCELQLKNTDRHTAAILRSFNPVYNGKPLFSYEYSSYFMTQWSIDPSARENQFLYYELFDRQIENKNSIVGEISDTSEFKGRILIVKVDETLHEGVSEEESEGFIDESDCPPIDTWFYFTENEGSRILFAWIPKQFVDLVDGGIAVNSIKSFYWPPNGWGTFS